ncbi:MAG: hypothetical protein ACR2ID_09795 [Chthoniobacterales bacterium]
MPLIPLALLFLLPLAVVILLPFSVVQRYRMGTARRRGRPWLASLNVVGISLSVVLFTLSAAIMNFWVPRIFGSAAVGLAGGALAGLLGLKLTRWESAADGLHYTPNRPLVFAISAVVAARILYGFWRAWQAWHERAFESSWLAASGAAGSLAVGGVVLGYYLIYWTGVSRRVKRHHTANRWHRQARR